MKHCCGKDDPKWNFNTPCLQDHEHTEVYYNYTTTVKTVTPFNVPKVENKVEVKLDNVRSILPGSILWNQKIGGMSVVSFDAATQTAIVTPSNINVDFGSLVPMGTEFAVGIPAIDINDTKEYLDSPYLAADFISPAVGECQNASVTSVSGLTINDKVSVAGYVYKVGAIINKSTLRLCNDGEGAEGGVVIAFDPEDCGEPSVPIIVYETSPCEATPVQTGNVVVCNNNSLTTLAGEADGQMLRWNNNHKRWELVNAYIDENCSYLTTCFTVDTVDQAYVATVKSTSLFNKDNKVIIEDTKFTIEEIVDSTHLKLKPETPFTEIVTYPTGTNVCLESCCAWVPEVLNDTVLNNGWIPDGVRAYTSTPQTIDTYMLYTSHAFSSSYKGPTPLETNLSAITKASPTFERDSATFNIVNYNKSYPLNVRIRMYSYAHGMPSGDNLKLIMKLSNRALVTTYTYNQQTQTVTANDPIEIPEFDVKSFNTFSGNDNPPQTLGVVQETCIANIPAYNEDLPQLSSIQFYSKLRLERLSNSDDAAEYRWYTADGSIARIRDRGSIVHHMVISFDYSGAVQ